MNENKLKSKMVLHGDGINDLAEYLKISPGTLRKKMKEENGEFSRNEMLKIKEKYSLTAEEIDDIFFDKEVS